MAVSTSFSLIRVSRSRGRARSNRLFEKTLNNRSLYTHDHRRTSDSGIGGTIRREKGKRSRDEEDEGPGPRGSPVETFTRRERERKVEIAINQRCKVEILMVRGRKGENASKRKGHALL